MYKNENLDSIIRTSLVKSSDGMFVTHKMFDKIISSYETRKSKRNIPFFLAKKAIFAAICCTLMFGLFLTFLPQAKAWAAEGINKIYYVITGENGYKIEEQDVLRTIYGDGYVSYVTKEEVTKDTVDTYVVRYKKPTLESTKLTGEKLNKYLGYNIKLPQLLGEDFKLKSKSVIKEEKNSLLLAVYENNYKIFVITSNHMYSSIPDDAKTMVKVGDKNGVWLESPIVLDKAGEVVFDPAQKPDKVKTNHILSWEDNGVYYSLMDTGNDMTIEKAVELSESIMEAN